MAEQEVQYRVINIVKVPGTTKKKIILERIKRPINPK